MFKATCGRDPALGAGGRRRERETGRVRRVGVLSSGPSVPPAAVGAASFDAEAVCLRRGMPPGSAQHPTLALPASCTASPEASSLSLALHVPPHWVAAVTASQFKVNGATAVQV